MNIKVLLAASVALNALFLGAEVYLLKQDAGDLDSLPPLILCVGHALPEGPESLVATSGTDTNSSRRENWRRVESEDYAEYVARLRGLGCSKKTICDIVSADVNEMFHRRAQPDVYTASRFAP